MKVRDLRTDDQASVLSIYREGIDTGHATFEANVPDFAAWFGDRVAGSCLAAAHEGTTVGFAALTASSSRCVYQGVAEVSVYVARASRGQGVGTLLLASLIERSELLGIWTLTAGIFPENAASIKIHKALGFCELGIHRRLARMSYGPMAGKWRDVVQLERRSDVVGIE